MTHLFYFLEYIYFKRSYEWQTLMLVQHFSTAGQGPHSVLCCSAQPWLPTETTWTEGWLGACLLLTTYVWETKRKAEEERRMTDSLAWLSAATRFPLWLLSCPNLVLSGFFSFLHASGTALEASWQRDCKGKAWRESRNEARAHFPRCSWLPSASEDLREHFQNKEIVCVGAQIASPRMYAHLHTDRDVLTLWDVKKCFSNSF